MRHFVQFSDVPSDFNLTSFSLWFSLSEAEERREAECALRAGTTEQSVN